MSLEYYCANENEVKQDYVFLASTTKNLTYRFNISCYPFVTSLLFEETSPKVEIFTKSIYFKLKYHFAENLT